MQQTISFFLLSDIWGRVSLWATDNQILFVIICILIIFLFCFGIVPLPARKKILNVQKRLGKKPTVNMADQNIFTAIFFHLDSCMGFLNNLQRI